MNKTSIQSKIQIRLVGRGKIVAKFKDSAGKLDKKQHQTAGGEYWKITRSTLGEFKRYLMSVSLGERVRISE